MPTPLTGRQIMVRYLQAEMVQATTADLQRAADFLAWAREVRSGCARQRSSAKRAQREAWRKYVDPSVLW
jgi:hypothetical protein